MNNVNLKKPLLGRVVVFAILLLVLMAVQSWVTYRVFTSVYPGGNDFAARWFNGCALLWSGENPYSDQVTLQTQIEMYGRPALLGEDLVAFSYPLYALFLFFPLCYVHQYTLVQAIWMTLMLYSYGVGTVVLLRVAKLEINRSLLVATLIWSILFYPAARALILGQMVILVYLFMALSLLLIQRRYDTLAGVLLALTTIKPQVSFLLIIWLLWWSANRKRWQIWKGLVGALGGLPS